MLCNMIKVLDTQVLLVSLCRLSLVTVVSHSYGLYDGVLCILLLLLLVAHRFLCFRITSHWFAMDVQFLIFCVGFFWFALLSWFSLHFVLPTQSFSYPDILFPAVHYNIPCLCNASWNQKETESDQDDEVIWTLLLLLYQR